MSNLIFSLSNEKKYNFYSILAKKIITGLIFPLILSIGLCLTSGEGLANLPYVFFVIFSPLNIFVIIYVTVRCTNSIFEISKEKEVIKIKYYRFNTKNETEIKSEQLNLVIRKDKYTIAKYLVLEFFDKNKRILKQFEINNWDKRTIEEFLNNMKNLGIIMKFENDTNLLIYK